MTQYRLVHLLAENENNPAQALYEAFGYCDEQDILYEKVLSCPEDSDA